MRLVDYIDQVKFLIHDAVNADFSQAELINAVNNARAAVALDFHCVRRSFLVPIPGTVPGPNTVYFPVSIIKGQEWYRTKGINGINRLYKEGDILTKGELKYAPIKEHIKAGMSNEEFYIEFGDEAYVGLSAVEGGAINVCGLFRRRRLSARGSDLLFAYLRACGMDTLANRLAPATLDRDSFSAVAALAFDRRVTPLDDAESIRPSPEHVLALHAPGQHARPGLLAEDADDTRAEDPLDQLK